MYNEKTAEEQLDFDKLEDICSQLTNEIKNIFDGTGIYFQILSRVKSVKSIVTKLNNGRYDMSGRHLQDLIGIRIIFYYFDDIKIAQDILENVFNMVDEWSESKNDVDKFRAIKRNGVFAVPKECMSLYTSKKWDMPIDTTFEIQLRTMFFEGWHEIEHDMRYKKNNKIGDLWEGSYSLSRMMNCVLANLELCDWSMVNLFDQLASNNLENGNLELMLKSRFRLKMKDEQLEPEIAGVFEKRPELARKYFECSRHTLIRELLKHEKPTITPSYIVRMLNEAVVRDEEIAAACDVIQWKKPERLQIKNGFRKIKRYPAFNYDVVLGHKDSVLLEDEAEMAAFLMYRWAYDRFSSIFEMPEQLCDFQSETPGYKLSIKRDDSKLKINLYAMYIDLERTGTLWNVYADCSEHDGKLHFTVRVNCDSIHAVQGQELFNRPHFVKEMEYRFGFIDIEPLDGEVRRVKSTDEYDKMKGLIINKSRKMPVIVVCQEGNDEERTLIKVSSLAKAVCGYAHIYSLQKKLFKNYNDITGKNADDLNGSVAIFWKKGADKDMNFYTREQILNSQFDFNRFVYSNGHIYEKAFRRKLLQIIKKHNRTDGC